jgi:hypothetical protein
MNESWIGLDSGRFFIMKVSTAHKEYMAMRGVPLQQHERVIKTLHMSKYLFAFSL